MCEICYNLQQKMCKTYSIEEQKMWKQYNYYAIIKMKEWCYYDAEKKNRFFSC